MDIVVYFYFCLGLNIFYDSVYIIKIILWEIIKELYFSLFVL